MRLNELGIGCFALIREMNNRGIKPTESAKHQRIVKILARAGVASRRDAERIVVAGRIAINGRVVTSPATLVGAHECVELDGKPITSTEPTRLWRYHKPSGLVTTARDPEGRATVFSTIPRSMPRVISVGRLDINTEGLLLLTNDGELARYLEHPAQAFERTYRVRVHGAITAQTLARLRGGVTVAGVRYRPAAAELDRRQGSSSWITLTLREGKNKEIKRLLGHFGLAVTRLIRIRYGPFALGNLERGAIAEVPPIRIAKVYSHHV
jgi:23S rRNA pseudouridine2605 synthase